MTDSQDSGSSHGEDGKRERGPGGSRPGWRPSVWRPQRRVHKAGDTSEHLPVPTVGRQGSAWHSCSRCRPGGDPRQKLPEVSQQSRRRRAPALTARAGRAACHCCPAQAPRPHSCRSLFRAVLEGALTPSQGPGAVPHGPRALMCSIDPRGFLCARCAETRSDRSYPSGLRLQRGRGSSEGLAPGSAQGGARHSGKGGREPGTSWRWVAELHASQGQDWTPL